MWLAPADSMLPTLARFPDYTLFGAARAPRMPSLSREHSMMRRAEPANKRCGRESPFSRLVLLRMVMVPILYIAFIWGQVQRLLQLKRQHSFCRNMNFPAAC